MLAGIRCLLNHTVCLVITMVFAAGDIFNGEHDLHNHYKHKQFCVVMVAC